MAGGPRWTGAGLSLVDLTAALAVISIILLGLFQLYGLVQTRLVRSQALLIAQQRAEITADYGIQAARTASLPAIASVQPFATGLPGFLDNQSLSVIALFGYQNRYLDNGTARCRLSQTAQLASPQLHFPSDCLMIAEGSDNRTLALIINRLMASGASLPVGLAGSGQRCASRQLIPASQLAAGQTAGLSLVDNDCLSDPSGQLALAGTELIFPRFVFFDRTRPARFQRAFFDDPARPHHGFAIELAASQTVQAGTISPLHVRLSGLDASLQARLEFDAANNGARLTISSPGAASLTGNDSASLQLSGQIGQLATALATLAYQNPLRGTDQLRLRGWLTGPANSGLVAMPIQASMMVTINP